MSEVTIFTLVIAGLLAPDKGVTSSAVNLFNKLLFVAAAQGLASYPSQGGCAACSRWLGRSGMPHCLVHATPRVRAYLLGAEVARKHQHAPGDELILSHGGGRTSFSNHQDTPFRVTGILAPTGTPVDQAVYISLAGMEAMHIGWESGIAIPGRTVTPDQARARDLTPTSVTAALVGIERKVMTFQVQRQINQYQGEPLSAVLPGVALSELWRIMGQFERALLGITGFVVITSLLGLVAVLLTLQAQRNREIAILRATGASPSLVAALQVIECVTLASIACLLALALSAGGLAVVSPWLLEQHGIQIGLRPLAAAEWLLLASVPATAALVGLLPALQAWRHSRTHGLSHGMGE